MMNADQKEMEHALKKYRSQTFQFDPKLRLRNLDDAVDFVEERGFVTLWPIHGIDLPSLWGAVAGERPVSSDHDDPGHVTWGWKDSMLDQRRWYYGKLLRGKATFVSLDVLPNFYALSRRVADIDDFREAYHAGHLSMEAKLIAEALLERGPTDTVRLRQITHLTSKGSKSRFNKALTDLQRGLWILPIGVAEAGSWRYAFIYELLDRWFPEIPERAHHMTAQKARVVLASSYFRSVGAAESSGLRKVMGWSREDTDESILHLHEKNLILELPDGRWASTDWLKELP
jgi:hypothetical protein